MTELLWEQMITISSYKFVHFPIRYSVTKKQRNQFESCIKKRQQKQWRYLLFFLLPSFWWLPLLIRRLDNESGLRAALEERSGLEVATLIRVITATSITSITITSSGNVTPMISPNTSMRTYKSIIRCGPQINHKKNVIRQQINKRKICNGRKIIAFTK